MAAAVAASSSLVSEASGTSSTEELLLDDDLSRCGTDLDSSAAIVGDGAAWSLLSIPQDKRQPQRYTSGRQFSMARKHTLGPAAACLKALPRHRVMQPADSVTGAGGARLPIDVHPPQTWLLLWQAPGFSRSPCSAYEWGVPDELQQTGRVQELKMKLSARVMRYFHLADRQTTTSNVRYSPVRGDKHQFTYIRQTDTSFRHGMAQILLLVGEVRQVVVCRLRDSYPISERALGSAANQPRRTA